MTENTGSYELVAPGVAARVGVSIPSFAAGDGLYPAVAQMALRVHTGRVVVHADHILPVVGGRSAFHEFLEFHPTKYKDLAAVPRRRKG